MLRNILQSAGLKPKVCAELLGIDHKLFSQWVNGQRPIPGYIVPELSSVLGVSETAILATSSETPDSMENAPAIWFKFRSGDKLTEADRELVVVIRRLGHYMDELEELVGSHGVRWNLVFEGAKKGINKQASPIEQGKVAARFFRDAQGLGFPRKAPDGWVGVGDILRENIRSTGIRVVETPLPVSDKTPRTHTRGESFWLEGCSFYVGAPGFERPCLFANTYKQTWFRRNMVLMHELAHAIFDIETSAAALDFGDTDQRQFEELRAEAFAQESLVPREVLNHVAETNGLRWQALSVEDVALLVAATQVEQHTVLRAASDAGFVSRDLVERYSSYEIHERLRQVTERALTREEFVEARRISQKRILSSEHRTTTIPSRALRLPLPYVMKIIELAKNCEISFGKAAEMLMIDKDTLFDRFGSVLEGNLA
jgi:Zn-dependent peptidase ImmA (M78 family)/transcriptional regulator with XRE-family HTH domain